MKIRNGFVSNSSSSSFIIPLKDIPSSVEELQEEMFGDASEVDYLYNWGDSVDMLDTYRLAEIVYNDIMEAAALSDEEIYDLAHDDWNGEEVCEGIEDIIKKYPGRKVIEISYSDNDGNYFTHLEHSGIIESTFKGSVRISQH